MQKVNSAQSNIQKYTFKVPTVHQVNSKHFPIPKTIPYFTNKTSNLFLILNLNSAQRKICVFIH